MALHLKLKPQTLANVRSVRSLSSSSTPPPPPHTPPDSDGGGENGGSAASPPQQPPYSSYFSDIKERLRSPPSPPRRIPDNPPPPPPHDGPNPSLEDIRKHLAEYRHKSGPPPPSSSAGRPPSAPPTLSFQELLKNNVLNRAGSDGDATAENRERPSLDSIRDSLRQFRSQPRRRDGQPPQSPFSFKGFPDRSRDLATDPGRDSTILGQVNGLPDSIFRNEMRGEGGGEGDGEGDPKALKTEFLKMYSYEELGEKLRKLRPPEASAKGGSNWFSLAELNDRLAKLRVLEEKEADSRMGGDPFRDLRESLVRLKEVDANKKANSRFRVLEEKEADSRMGGVPFRDLRESLVRLKEADANKKANMQRLSILTNLGGYAQTPTR